MSELYSLLEDFREDYRHNPSFGSIILEDLYTSSGRIIILPIGGYLHVLTFLSDSHYQKIWIMEPSSWTSPKWPNQITLPKSCRANWKPLTHPGDGNGQKDNYGSKGASTYPTKRSSAYR